MADSTPQKNQSLTPDEASKFMPDQEGNLVARTTTKTHIVTAIRTVDGSAMVVTGEGIDSKGKHMPSTDFNYKVRSDHQIFVADEKTHEIAALDKAEYDSLATTIAVDFFKARTNDNVLDVSEADKLVGHGLKLNGIINKDTGPKNSR